MHQPVSPANPPLAYPEICGSVAVAALSPLTQGGKYESTEQVFFKSQVSLAETCQEDPNRNHSFEADIFDEECLSMDSQDCSSGEQEVEICQDFLTRGHCLNPHTCGDIHEVCVSEAERSRRQKRVRLWLWDHLPEIFLLKTKRPNSFLN